MIKRIITYFLIVTALLYGLRYLHYKGLVKQKEGYYGKLQEAFFEENAYSVLFLGSSRAEMHYDTQLFDSLTGENSFNLGLAGATPRVAFSALKAYLLHSKAPKYLIYEVDYYALKKKSSEIKEFNNYFPLLTNPVLRKQFSNIDSRMSQFYYNPYFSWPYTGLKNLSTSIHGWLNIPNQTDSLYYKGFVREVFRPSLNFISTKKQYAYFNISERSYLDSIIACCIENNTKITLMSSPIFAGGYLDVLNKASIISQLKNIATINKIDYYDLSSLPFCNNRGLFIDHRHLNYTGAKNFNPHLVNIFNNKIVLSALK
ncbi:hypothetical protein [Aurantibacillus circumpalustris]|uniref:hypothetical protein n=1 Tax=Aurantibacillus circumpalustris TaxID=3036359 RepID=UPI00295A8FC0|nr:hypothetical protein [Aurantibacillus circumpalustris]